VGRGLEVTVWRRRDRRARRGVRRRGQEDELHRGCRKYRVCMSPMGCDGRVRLVKKIRQYRLNCLLVDAFKFVCLVELIVEGVGWKEYQTSI
jgi:hypothetical protein